MTALVALGLCCLFLALHPFTTYPLSLMIARGVRRDRINNASLTPVREPSFAICLSAFNEESVIRAKIANLLELKSTVTRCDIYIYVDAATDRTAELIAPYRDRVFVVIGAHRAGKSHGLNKLVEATDADIVVFTDANVMLDMNALKHIGAKFADPKVGCVCGNLIYVNSNESATAAAGSRYWRMEEAIKQLESDTWGVIGADGSLFAIRRQLHVPTPDDLIDDFYLSMQILLRGYRVVRAEQAQAYERTATKDDEEFRRKVRISCQAFNVHRIIWRRVRGNLPLLYCYVSHRLLKWIIIYNLGMSALLLFCALALSANWLFIFSFFVTATAFAATVCMLDFTIIRQFRSMAVALAGAGWGVWRSFRGDRFRVWTPISTVR